MFHFPFRRNKIPLFPDLQKVPEPSGSIVPPAPDISAPAPRHTAQSDRKYIKHNLPESLSPDICPDGSSQTEYPFPSFSVPEIPGPPWPDADSFPVRIPGTFWQKPQSSAHSRR